MADRLTNKVALITGGASGLGKISAELMVAEGARVMLSDRNLEAAEATAAAIGDAAAAIEHDVTDEARWIEVLDATVERFGKLDILVNSAGVFTLNTVERATLEEFNFTMSVNCDGTFLGCKHAIGAMTRDGNTGGSIINISSISGIIAGYNTAAYNASKGAVRLLTKSVALHCARQGHGIRCNSVHPTFIDTPMLREIIDGSRDPAHTVDVLVGQIPLGRLGEPADVGHAIVYLASDESRFMTGAEIVLDGGMTAQ